MRLPSGLRPRKSRSTVVISSQKATLARVRPPAPPGIATRVGPSRPRENNGMTITSSVMRFRTFSETMRAGLGWWGSSGWPGVDAIQISPRRGIGLLTLRSVKSGGSDESLRPVGLHARQCVHAQARWRRRTAQPSPRPDALRSIGLELRRLPCFDLLRHGSERTHRRPSVAQGRPKR
jgi:hypothetical protein